MSMKKLLCLPLFLILTVISYQVSGQARTTSQAGPWNQTSTWGGQSVPDNTFGAITVNHAVTVTANVTIDQATVGAAGSITVDPLVTLSINGGAGADLTVTGGLTINGTLTNVGAPILALNGTFTNNGTISLATAGTVTTGAGSVSTLTNPSSTTFNGLTLNGTAANSFVANSALTISGVLTINAGASVTANSTSTVTKGAGNFVGTGSYISTGSTVFSGASTLSGAGQKTFNNLTVNATVTPNVSYTVTGNIDGTGTLAAGTGVATFSGTSSLISGSGAKNFFDMTINGGTAVTYNTNITISGNNLVGNGSLSTDVITSPAIITFTTLTLSGAGTKDFTNVTIGTGASTIPNASYTVRGNMVITGTLSQGNATTTFAGTTVISGVGASTFNNVAVSSGASVASTLSHTINGTLTNNGTINFTAGTLTLGAASVTNLTNPLASTTFNALTTTAGATITDAANTNLTITGNFTAGANYTSLGTTTFNGTVALSGAGTITFNNLVVNGTSLTPGVNISYTVNGNISGTGTLAAGSGTSLTTFAGTTTLISGSGAKNFFDVTINLGTSVTYSSNVTFSGNNFVGNGSLATDVISSPAIITFTTIAISGAGTKDFTNVTIGAGASTTFNAAYTVRGNLVVTGTLAQGSGTVTFGGTTIISGAGAHTFNNVLVSSGASVSGAVSHTINGTFTNNGTVNFTGGTLTLGAASVTNLTNTLASTTFSALTTTAGAAMTDAVGSNLTITGNFSSGANYLSIGTTTFNGTVILTATGTVTFNNLVVNGTSLTPNAAYTVNGNISGTGTLAAGNNTATLAGSATLISGTGAKNFNDLTINVGTAATYSSAVTISGTALIGNGSLVSVNSASTISMVSITVSGAGTKDFHNVSIGAGTTTPNADYTVRGNLAVTGTLAAGTGTTTFAGTTTITQGTITFNNMAISASSTLTLSAGTIRVNGNINNAGTVNSGTGTIQFGGTTTVTNTGTFNVNNVSFAAAANTLNAPATSMGIAGNFTSNGVFNNGGGTILFNGSATQTLSATETYSSVTVNPGAIVTSGSSQNINGTFTNNGSFTLTAGTLTLGATSISTLASTSTTSLVTLTLTANGAAVTADGTLTVSGVLTINASASITAGATSSVTKGAGNFVGTGNYISSGSTTFSGATTLSGAGAKTFNNLVVNGTVSMAAISYQVNGNITGIGTLNAGTGASIVTFGGGVQTVSVTNASFNNVTINNGSTFTAGTNVIITGNLAINGAFSHGNRLLTFTTAGTKNISGNPTTFFDITVGNGAVSTTVTNQLTPLSLVGRLTLNTAVVNTFNTGNNLILLSTADNPTSDGSIGALSGVAVSVLNGSYTAQRFVSSENRIYRYISAPVVGATVAQLKAAIPVTGIFTDPSDGTSTPPCTGCISTKPSLFSFNETTAVYDTGFPGAGQSSGGTTFANGRGYSAFFRHTGLGAVGIVTINFNGTHPSSAGVPLTVSPNPLGYSLVGNPYPSAIVWNNGAGWVKTNIGDNIVIRDNAGSNVTFSAAAGNGVIAAGQSFWVQSSAAGASLQVNENAKTALASIFHKIDAPIFDELEMSLTRVSTARTDNAKVVTRIGSSQGYEAFDSYEFISDGVAIPDLHFISTLSSDSQVLGINAIPSVACGQTFNIYVTNFTKTSDAVVDYTMSINPTGAMKALVWTLHDNYLNSNVDLSANPNYNFQVDNSIAASQAANRFTLTAASNSPIAIGLAVTSTSQICESSSAAVTIAGSQTNMMYGVEVNGTYYPNVAQGTGNDLNIPVKSEWLNATTSTVKVKANSGCDSQFLSAIAQVTKEVLYNAVASSVQSCTKGSVTLSATGAAQATNYNWFETVNASTPVATGNQFITPYLSDTTTYYVAAFNSLGCEGTRLAVTANISDLSAQVLLTANATEVCRGSSITFNSASNLTGTFKWYETATSTDVLATSAQFTTPALFKTRKYYVTFVNNNGCEGDRVEAVAQVSNFSPVLSASNGMGANKVCAQGSYTFVATGAPISSQYVWYDAVDSAIPLVESTEFTTVPLAVSRSYWLAARNELGCYTDRYEVVAPVDLSDPSVSISPSSVTICANTSAVVKFTDMGSNSTYNWYESTTSTTKINEGLQYTTDVLTSDKSIFVAAVNSNGCEGSKVEMKVLVPNFNPELLVTKTKEVLCVQGSNTLKVSGASVGSTYEWFETGSPKILSTGSEYTTQALEATKSYSLWAKNGLGCSSPAKEVVVIVDGEDASTNMSASVVGVICNGGSTNIVVKGGATNGAYNWYDTPTGGNRLGSGATFTTEVITGNKSYFVSSVNSNGCEGATRVEVPVTVITYAEPKINQISDNELESTYDEGNQWYFNNSVIANANGQTLNITGDGVYGLKVSIGDCQAEAPVFGLVTGFGDAVKTIRVYPNPVSEVLSIQFVGRDNVKVHFMDERGTVLTPVRLLSDGNVQVGELDVHTFSKGLYFIRIFSESKSITHKVIIK